MPVKNNITGIWRHLKLVNCPDTLLSGYTSGSSLTGSSTDAMVTEKLNEICILADKVDSSTEQSVSNVKLLQGDAKTHVVNIQESVDTMSVSGPMLFAEDTTGGTAQILLRKSQLWGGPFGDASTVAIAYLYNALNIDPSSTEGMNSFAESISFTLDENGFNWRVSLRGDPTSLRPKYYDATNSTLPFGHNVDGGEAAIETACRVATYYDFYAQAQVKMATADNTFATTTLHGAIQSMTSDIKIEAEPIKLIGRGQAPVFAIGGVSMSGSMSVVFPLLATSGSNSWPTPVPTWQAVPEPWGDAMGNREMTSTSFTPEPINRFPDAPDVFTVDTISVVPLYACSIGSTPIPVIDGSAFGEDSDMDLSNMPAVIRQASESIGPGIIKSELSYEVVFRGSD